MLLKPKTLRVKYFLTFRVSRNDDLSEKDNITMLKLKHELSYDSSFLCVILVGCCQLWRFVLLLGDTILEIDAWRHLF